MSGRSELAELVSDLKRRLEASTELDFHRPENRPQISQTAQISPTAVKAAAGSPTLESEAAAASACTACPLGKTRIKAVYGVGSPTAQVVFVGEGPGYEEDRRGEPFVGKAGQLLDKIMASIGLDRTNAYIANMVKCHPMIRPDEPDSRGNDRPPSPEELAACRPFLDRQLSLIKPKVVVTLGAVAGRALLNTTSPISMLRGRWQKISVGELELDVLPTYHPAALLRNPGLKRDVWNDMKALKKFLEDVPE
jgi:DNA polymerase